jgi:hypothetical protein
MTEPIALTDEAVCSLLGLTLTARKIIKLRAIGEFPPFTLIAGKKMVLRSDLDAWLAAQREKTAEIVARRSEQARKSVAARWGHPQE